MLEDLGQRRQVLARIRSRLPDTLLISDRATDLFRDYDWVRAQGNAATLIVIVILIVAAFGVASGQLMMVQERRALISPSCAASGCSRAVCCGCFCSRACWWQ